jgi:N6-L-threonylcarbamoyladenine synthase
MQESKLDFKDLDGVACTFGPGLVGTLLVGVTAAKAISFAHEIPLINVDHLLSHICANYLDSDIEPPFVALLVSGGHTQLMYFDSYKQSRILGQTLDDAAGEAFDKVGRLLNLPYPGGPEIDRLGKLGNKTAFNFPEGKVSGYDFSFSGLKTAVLRTVEKLSQPLPVNDLAASFQDAVVRVLVKKTLKAQLETKAPAIVVAGGVSANSALREALARQSCVPVHFPKLKYCTDNAAMVASAAYFCGYKTDLSAQVYSRA